MNESCNHTIAHLKQLLQHNDKMNDVGDDAAWILTSAFIIFTMQSGFGLLEAGSVSSKNEANIMVKNAIDVIFGGLSYWIWGFAFSSGTKKDKDTPLTGFMGYGDFFTGTIDHVHDFGSLYSKYFFQLSFATTATTIVSGAMAERTNLKAYILFSFVNTFSYVFPAHWIWDKRGFLHKLHVVDVGACAPVHLVGGVSALVATIMLRPRTGRFDETQEPPPMASPTNMMLGTFMLWWGWLGFTCGSTLGISGTKWKLAARTAVVTMNGSIGGSIFSILYSCILTKSYKGKLDIPTFINGILGGLVSITAICSLCQPWAAFIIGFIGGAIANYGAMLLRRVKVDDPVGCIPVHGFCSVWGMIVVGLWVEKDVDNTLSKYSGIFYGGPPMFLVYQILACVVIITWTAINTYLQLLLADKLFGIRVSVEEEIRGADEVEHGINQQDAVVENGFHTCCINNLNRIILNHVKQGMTQQEAIVGNSCPKNSCQKNGCPKNGCQKCLLNNFNRIILNSPKVILNKTYAKKINNTNGDVMNNLDVSSNIHNPEIIEEEAENIEEQVEKDFQNKALFKIIQKEIDKEHISPC